MSLVIIANKTTNQELFGRFIDDIKGLIASNNSKVDSGAETTGYNQKVDLNAFISKARELVEADKLVDLLQHILTVDGLLINDPKTFVSAFYILSLLCNKINDKDQQLESVKKLVHSIVSKDNVSSGTKFKLLGVLFNGFDDENSLRYEIFCAILALATEINKPNVVLTHLNNINEYVAKWNLSKEQEARLLKLAVTLINKCDNKLYREKYEFYSKYLRLIHAKFDEKLFNENKEEIKTVLKTALNYFPYEIDISSLLDLKPVQEIAKSDKGLYDLFVTAVEGNLTDFNKWTQANSNFLAQNHINQERVLDRVRLKSIFQEVQKSKVLKLKEIEKLLQLDQDETEFWIIKVHQEGHIRGKIDQLEGTLYIDGIIDDSFKNSEWKDLEKNLTDFRKKYEDYIEKLRSDKSK